MRLNTSNGEFVVSRGRLVNIKLERLEGIPIKKHLDLVRFITARLSEATLNPENDPEITLDRALSKDQTEIWAWTPREPAEGFSKVEVSFSMFVRSVTVESVQASCETSGPGGGGEQATCAAATNVDADLLGLELTVNSAANPQQKVARLRIGSVIRACAATVVLMFVAGYSGWSLHSATHSPPAQADPVVLRVGRPIDLSRVPAAARPRIVVDAAARDMRSRVATEQAQAHQLRTRIDEVRQAQVAFANVLTDTPPPEEHALARTAQSLSNAEAALQSELRAKEARHADLAARLATIEALRSRIAATDPDHVLVSATGPGRFLLQFTSATFEPEQPK
jgi:hypothetical protein